MTKPTGSIGQLLLYVAGPGLWAAYFFFIYGFQTLMCLRPADAARDSLFLVLAVAATLAMFAGLLVFVRWRSRGASSNGEEAAFRRRVSFDLTALSALAGFWVALAAVIIPLCP